MTAAYALSVLSELLPEDAVVVEEAPSHRPALHEHLPIRRPGGFLTGQSGVLGYGLPAAVGVAMAVPNRPVVALIGDGSSMYGIQGLWTAAREHVPVTFVVLDNGQYGAMRNHAGRLGITKAPGIQLGGLDFVALAQGFGCAAVRVDAPEALGPALARALAADVPTLVHVVVDR
jgi:benzoylformate decarboxylase